MVPPSRLDPDRHLRLVLLLLWQVHVERRKNAALTGAVRQYIHGAAQINSALEIVSGRLNQCEAITY